MIRAKKIIKFLFIVSIMLIGSTDSIFAINSFENTHLCPLELQLTQNLNAP